MNTPLSTRNIFLIGPMGAGKSTIGKALASATGLAFVDSDREIEERTGAAIPLIFEIEGEAGFRDRESAMIDELTQKTGIVLATGGGAIMRPENREALKARGTVVYLHAPVAQQLARTAHDTNRPLLQTEDRAARLTELMKLREPLYREIADIVVLTDGQGPRKIVNQILRDLR
ncbi:MAG: shikimate kinase AroK [Halothiobacillaceae bacterium]